jgi:nitrogen fixation/metabolism regulation signal transduction histidine kinase
METTRGCEESFQFESSAETRARSAAHPGILVFSRTLQLLYVNRRAVDLIGACEMATTGQLRFVLSTPVIEFLTEVQQVLDARLAAWRWEPCELGKTIEDPGHRMHLRGIGLPDREARDRSRIIIVVEDDALVQETALGLMCEDLPLSNLQEAVA